MQAGDVLDGRFELERPAGKGGMAQVFRARDRASGEPVAVKVLLDAHASQTARFLREADVLAELDHPAIVRLVGREIIPSGPPWFAMEWLDGEDLGERLRRGRLGVDEALALASRVADALAVVHARGVVHRDLKPSNLFLAGGDVAQVKIIDFGILREISASPTTQAGTVLGTPAYMAPEQVAGGRAVDVRADVFALGCVLFECLTGVTAFAGEHVIAVLAKVLLADAPRVRDLRPDVPVWLEALCARMLEKSPDARPASGAEVARALAAAGRSIAPDRPSIPEPRASQAGRAQLTDDERRVLSVVLIGPAMRPPGEEGALSVLPAAHASLRRAVEVLGSTLEVLADGSMLVMLAGVGLATDQAAHAARVALAVAAIGESGALAVVTGRAERSGRVHAGPLIDRATRMVLESAPDARGRVVIDEVTAGLLDARFEVTEEGAALVLRGERPLAAGARTLLGKATACVGRDWELTSLEAMIEECASESEARAVLLTSPAGMGKSRVTQELLRRVASRDEEIRVWIGRGDPLHAGSALGLLGEVVRGACGLHDGEPLELRREKILARVAAHVPSERARGVAEIVGEIVGAPFPDEDSVPLRAARADAQIMGDQVRLAFVDLLDAECAAGPLLLVLEDLHWSDRATVDLVDQALRRLRDRPLLVLGVARPEVHAQFPRLWTERGVRELSVRELSPKACARLVRQSLGAAASADLVERLVAQSEGNAFYLEELVRAAARGGGEAPPETVLAVLQSRLEAVDPASRRLLRAASVLGEIFWRGAVEAMLGEPEGSSNVASQLARLEASEWIAPRSEARFQGQTELCFRHALTREAVYASLTEDDRALGHKLAGAWLEGASDPRSAVIAQHLDRGGDPARAAFHYQRAAAQALLASDLGGALAHAQRALDLGATGEARAELALLRAEALRWRSNNAEAAKWARIAMEALPRGSAPWCTAVAEGADAARAISQLDQFASSARELASVWAAGAPTTALVIATARVAVGLLLVGPQGLAQELCGLLDGVAERFYDDPTAAGHIHRWRAFQMQSSGQHDRSRAHLQRAIPAFERAGDLRRACNDRVNLSAREGQLGAHHEAVTLLRAALADADRMGLDLVRGLLWCNLGHSLGALGDLTEARVLEGRAIEAFVARGDRRLEGNARIYLAGILLRAGEPSEAEAEARRAIAVLPPGHPLQVYAGATLARALLDLRRTDEALAEARAANDLLASLGATDEGEVLARLLLAEALHAAGRTPEAALAIDDARRHVLAAAGAITDPARRETYLRDIAENARVLSLADEWLAAPAKPAPA